MITKINFTSLTTEESMMVLKWRNTFYIRSQMLHKKIITKKEHSNFLESLKLNNTKHYFLVKEDHNYIGVIYLVDGALGIYAKPNLKGKGDILLKMILDFAKYEQTLIKIKCEVYVTNHKAIQLYNRFGFKLIDVNDDLAIMELKL